MDSIEIELAEVLITESLRTLRKRAAQLRGSTDVANSLIAGGLDPRDIIDAAEVRKFANRLQEFREAKWFFLAEENKSTTFEVCCDAAGLNVDAVRDQIRKDSGLDFNTRLAHKAAAKFMYKRRETLYG
jgi:hypothetical protein